MTMGRRKKSAREKLEGKEPQIVEIPQKLIGKYGMGMMLIPAPQQIKEIIKLIPQGRIMTVTQIRNYLARKFQVVTTCPLVTGIYIKLIVQAAEEEGAGEPIPWWRVVKSDGSLNPKLPGGGLLQKERLEKEGLVVVQKRKKLKVANFKDYLWEPEE